MFALIVFCNERRQNKRQTWQIFSCTLAEVLRVLVSDGFSRFQSDGVRATGFIGTMALYNSFKHMILIIVENLFSCSGKMKLGKLEQHTTHSFSSLWLLIACFLLSTLGFGELNTEKEEQSRGVEIVLSLNLRQAFEASFLSSQT